MEQATEIARLIIPLAIRHNIRRELIRHFGPGAPRLTNNEYIDFLSNPHLYINRMALSYVRWWRQQQTRRRRGNVPRARVGYMYRMGKRINKLEKGQVGKEFKLTDVADSGTFAGAGVIHYISAIAQGDQSLNREGLKINLQSIQLKAVYTKSANQDHDLCRLMIFTDRKNQGALPNVVDVLETANYLAFKEHDETNRFRIFYDKMIPVNETAGTTTKAHFLTYYKKFTSPVKIHYQGTSANIGDASNNALFILLIAASATTTYATNIRLRFTE